MNNSPFGSFRASSPDEMRRLLRDVRRPWWIAGGWAIDLFVGGPCRSHDDLDVEIWREDAQTFRSLFSAWEFFAPHPSVQHTDWPFLSWETTAPPPDGAWNAWCRPGPTAPWEFELLLADHDAEQWRFRRDPAITRPRSATIQYTPAGIPYLAPELQLLYKAKQPRPKDERDLCLALPLLAPARRRWLADTLHHLDPDHPWLAEINQR